MSETLILKIKQGEELNRLFTITQDNSPLDLSGYSISFQVRRSPIEQSKPIIDKVITEDSDINDIGQINFATNGKFTVHIKKEESSIPVGEYSLSVALVKPHIYDIISAPYCSSGVFEVCEK